MCVCVEVLNTSIWFILTLSWGPKKKPTMGTVDAEIMVAFAENLELWIKLIYIFFLNLGVRVEGVLFCCFAVLFSSSSSSFKRGVGWNIPY